MNETQTTVGVIVGRFQSSRLTPGHVHLINTALLQNKEVVLFIGSAARRFTKKNVVPFIWRQSMIQADPRLFRHASKLIILEAKDKGNDEVWSEALQNQLNEVVDVPNSVIRLYGSRDSSFLKGFAGDYQRVELLPFAEFSASEMRQNIATQYPSGTEADDKIREGMIIAAYGMRDRVDSAVDIAILDVIDKQVGVWLGRKPAEKRFRFIGGYADPSSKKDEVDAKREAKEESGMTVGMIEYIDNLTMDDWRYRGDADTIRTRFFAGVRIDSVPVAGDDICELLFVPIHRFNPNDLMDVHQPLGQIFIDWSQSKRGIDYIASFLFK